ncbi:MAG: aminopeptidase P family protein [Chloroflexi bacterium]|nr:MAG: aminopeptidase P family protein [Chloroflexota bacterium]MBL1195240.1 aminopeptidase P family protein [Chloroflexota bacterium]NOH12526.1 aminopeptidase P family protein [Chloroflexota bacterium]
MKSDIDSLMQAANLDAILVSGSAQHNPTMFYLTGGAHMTHGELIKKRGEEAVLYYSPMERDEAARTGLPTRNLMDYNYQELLKESDGNAAQATAKRYKQMLSELGIESGRMAVYGKVEAGPSYTVLTALQQLMPEIEIVGEMGRSVLLQAMETKDASEAERMRRMGQITVEVVDRVASFLQEHKAKDGILVKADDQPLTIGDIKKKISAWVAGLGVENPHGVIFAIGHDAGVPHSTGNPEDLLQLGKTIVFDIFLQEPGGGYHYDFTRTWCLGHAPEAEQKLYDDVKFVFDDIMGGLEANAPFPLLQKRTCDLFEEQGHPTIQSDPRTQEGYVHSIGHGLGLNVHEQPSARGKGNLLKPGVVVTIEPGLYYPEKGMGVRIEDTVYVREDGEIEVLAEYPHDLVLPISKT